MPTRKQQIEQALRQRLEPGMGPDDFAAIMQDVMRTMVAGGISVALFDNGGIAHRCGWCEQRLEAGDIFVQHERAGELHASRFVDEMGMLMESTGS